MGENANSCYTMSKVTNAPKVGGDTKKQELAYKVWLECKQAEGSAVEVYLSSRGYRAAIPVFIRYHPALYHSPTKSQYPAMVAAIFRYSDKSMLGIHRTYLEGYLKNFLDPQLILNKICCGKL